MNYQDKMEVSRRNRPFPFRPVMLAVDDEPEGLDRVERELRKRYEADYQVVCEGSAEAGMRRLRDLKAAEEEVAVVLADQRMPLIPGIEFLSRAHKVYPVAKRLLLIDPMDRNSFAEAARAMALGRIDYVEYERGGPGSPPLWGVPFLARLLYGTFTRPLPLVRCVGPWAMRP